MRVHTGTLLAGLVYLGLGAAFVAEAVGWWTLRLGDLQYLGPLALVVVGIAVVVGSLSRRDVDHH